MKKLTLLPMLLLCAPMVYAGPCVKATIEYGQVMQASKMAEAEYDRAVEWYKDDPTDASKEFKERTGKVWFSIDDAIETAEEEIIRYCKEPQL